MSFTPPYMGSLECELSLDELKEQEKKIFWDNRLLQSIEQRPIDLQSMFNASQSWGDRATQFLTNAAIQSAIISVFGKMQKKR